MASSAFKSTTRRSLHASASSSRSRSGRDLQEDYANTRTNPLFDSAASPSASPSPQQRSAGTASATSSAGGDATRREERDRGREPAKGGGRGGRARSVSVAPQRRRTDSATSVDTAAAVGGRRSSRARSVTDGARPDRGSETDAESRDTTRKLQSRRSRDSVLESKHRLDGTSASHPSQGSAAGVDPVDPVLEIPPEFDPDSAEFISDISDYVTEHRKDEAVHIPLDFDTDASELAVDVTHDAAKQDLGQLEIPLEFDLDAMEEVSELRHYSTTQQWEQIEIPLEFDPETAGLTTDITEYTIKLNKSHERARKLRADLAVEEQREHELSRMLKDIVTFPNFTETHKKRPRRKSSIERLRVSRHLAEEAMNYFEECVSISTMDSTDFSSPEDPQPNSLVSVPPKNNSSFPEPHPTTDQHGLREESESQTQCSVSITGSDASDSVFFGHVNPLGSKVRSNSSDDIDGFDTPRSRSSCFSFTREPIKPVQNCDVQQYIGNFGRGNNKALSGMSSRYSADDYASQKENMDLLTDIMAFQNRIEYGGLLVCCTRTF